MRVNESQLRRIIGSLVKESSGDDSLGMSLAIAIAEQLGGQKFDVKTAAFITLSDGHKLTVYPDGSLSVDKSVKIYKKSGNLSNMANNGREMAQEHGGLG